MGAGGVTDIERLKTTKNFLREQYQENLKKCKHPELKPLIIETYHENIKAFDIAISALEKQIPKKPTHEATKIECCTCPDCKNVIDEFETFWGQKIRVCVQFCKYCGQALDWGDCE